jgi:predicted permease
VGYRNDLVGDLRLPLLVLAVSIGLVLAVLAANVSSLFAAQGERRRRELAVRAALGAGRARLVMQIAWESVLVCLSGGVAGVAVAWWSAAPLVRAYPGTLPRAGEIQLDGSVVFGSLMAVTLIGLLAGAAPAHGLTRTALSDGLRAGDRGSSGRVRRSRQVLIAAELALSCAVTIAAFLLVQSFTRLQSTPLGFDPDRVVTATVSVSGTAAASEAEATRFFDDLVARLQAHPGVAAAGAMSSVPLVNRPPPDDFMIEGRPASPPGEPGFNAHYVVVTPGVFEALGARIMRGRAIDARDIAPDAPVAVINETLQRRYWPDRDPLGGRIRYPTGIQDGEWSSWTPWISVVGVLDDLRSVVPAAAPEPAIYVAHAQRPRAAYSGATMGVVVRPRADGGAAPSVIRDAARSVDPRAVATPARPLAAVVGTVLARPRFVGGLMSLLAVTTLAIAVIGVYGLVSHTVSSRTREIGVRMALGASRGRILTLVARQLWTTLGAGLPAGLLGAWLLARWMDALLYGVEPWEPRIYLAVAASLTFVVVAAVVAPARRAARVDPSGALRAE